MNIIFNTTVKPVGGFIVALCETPEESHQQTQQGCRTEDPQQQTQVQAGPHCPGEVGGNIDIIYPSSYLRIKFDTYPSSTSLS